MLRLDIAGMVRTHMDGLTDSLSSLRDRVRSAVAGEMAKAVAEALRELLHAVLQRSANPPEHRSSGMAAGRFASDSPMPSPVDRRWDLEDDEVPEAWPATPWPAVSSVPPSARASDHRPAPTDSATAPADAVRTGAGLATWLLRRQVPVVAGIGLGLAAGLAALSGHPLVRTLLGVAAAAAELIAFTEIGPTPP